MQPIDRRGFLAVSAAALGATAGCLGGSDGETDRSPPGDLPAFADQLFDPAIAETDSYAFAHADVATVAGTPEYEALSGGKIHDLTASMVGAPGSDAFGEDAVEDGVTLRFSSANTSAGFLTGTFDVSALRDEYDSLVESRDDADREEYGPYDLYTIGKSAVAVTRADGTSVFVNAAADAASTARRVVTALIDARTGDADAYYAADDAVAEILGRLSTAEIALVDPAPSPSGIDAEGRTVRWADDALQYEVVALVAVEDPDPAAVLDAGAYGTDIERWDHEVDGRVVTLRLEYDPDDPADVIEVSRERPPQLQLEFRFDRSAGEARIRHAGGEPADASNLRVVVESGDDRRRLRWTDLDDDATFFGSQSVTVPIESGEWGGTIRVRWVRSDGRATETIGEATLSE